MSINIVELFGYSPRDNSNNARKQRESMQCPFINDNCTKRFRDGEISGACTVKPVVGNAVICCPNRLYAHDYKILSDVAESAFGSRHPLFPAHEAVENSKKKPVVAVFGKKWGRELRLPSRGRAGRGSYFVDWVLALLDKGGKLKEFVAVEIQTIDTTGTYRSERDAYMRGDVFEGNSKAGLNWENVSKRILPQIIYKGHVLRRESLCKKGLFFVCPLPVYERTVERLGGTLLNYTFQPGALTFRWYDLEHGYTEGSMKKLEFIEEKTTTVDQIALAFTSPSNLPDEGVYEKAIEDELKRI